MARRYKPALINVDPEDWRLFREVCDEEEKSVSARVRELVARDLNEYTSQQVRAQSLAGLTEA